MQFYFKVSILILLTATLAYAQTPKILESNGENIVLYKCNSNKVEGVLSESPSYGLVIIDEETRLEIKIICTNEQYTQLEQYFSKLIMFEGDLCYCPSGIYAGWFIDIRDGRFVVRAS